MGLSERRAAKEFQERQFPDLQAKLHAAAGTAVALTVEWDALQTDDEAHLYEEAWREVYFTPLIGALAAITIDDLGRDAVRAKLRQIAIRNSGTRVIAFLGGMLMLDLPPTTNIGDVKQRQAEIQRVLEQGL